MISVLPIHIISIDNDGFHLLTQIVLNRKKATVIIDTGASRTVFDKTRIKHFVKTRSTKIRDKLSTGLGTNSMESHHVKVSSLRIGDIKLKDYFTVLLDLKHVNTSYAQLGLPQIDGVLGSDILHEYNAVIDFKKRELRLEG
jgi:predicted aspartyl protease